MTKIGNTPLPRVEARLILLLIALLFLQRLYALHTLGVDYHIGSDDVSYLASGLRFAETGQITMHTPSPSAQIMPAMPLLIGLYSLVFGSGEGLWLALKLTWALMGSMTAYFLFRSARLFVPTGFALLAPLPLFRVDFVWTDSLILTETPFILCLSAMVYFTLSMAKTQSPAAFWGCLFFYILALLLKANIAPFPLLAMGYLLLHKYPFRLLLGQGLILGAVLLLILTPWTLRNYRQFHAFIPLTYGSGNPLLLGSYQGYGYPADETLDYETHVDIPFRERYAAYFLADGSIPPAFEKYLALAYDGMKASYRLAVWWQEDPLSMLDSYLRVKPGILLDGVFYWDEIWDIPIASIETIARYETRVFFVLTALGIALPGLRREMAFLLLLYLSQIGIYALTFAFGRYSIGLLPLRYLLMSLSAWLVCTALSRFLRTQTH